jgi:hypothetical protein
VEKRNHVAEWIDISDQMRNKSEADAVPLAFLFEEPFFAGRNYGSESLRHVLDQVHHHNLRSANLAAGNDMKYLQCNLPSSIPPKDSCARTSLTDARPRQ